MEPKKSPILRKLESENLLKGGGKVLDLGCGKGMDSIYLSSIGYSVDAIDLDQDSITHLKQNSQVNAVCSDIYDYDIKPSSYNLIIASNSLPFLDSKEKAVEVIKRSINGLVSGGIFYFSLFGPRDAWASRNNMNFHNYEEVKSFLATLPISIYFTSTEEGNANNMKGELKWWHIHRFYCVKN